MPFGKYEYQRLPMGLRNSPDIFQERMYDIFSDLEYICVYIDNLLVMSCSTFEEHLQKLELVFSRLSEVGLKINANKSHFAVSEIEYLGYWITRNGIQPVHKKSKQFNALLLQLLRNKLDLLLDLSITIKTCGPEDQKF
jgi:putative transposase